MQTQRQARKSMRARGHTSSPSLEQIRRESAYYAAVYGNYDTSKAAQEAELLTITILDAGEGRPPRTTHRFSIVINYTVYFVSRYHSRYEVEPADQTIEQRQEQELREEVLETALRFLTGASYPRGHSSQEERAYVIAKLLEEGAQGQEHEERDLVSHPVVRDELPVPHMESEKAGEMRRAERQWSVIIGRHSCQVGLFGINEDGIPNLVALDIAATKTG